MSVLAGSPLSPAADYERWLFIRLSGLFDAARANVTGMASAIDAAEKSLAILDDLVGNQVVRGGSPFFWLNVHRLFTTDEAGAAIRRGSDRVRHLPGIRFILPSAH